MITRHSHIRRLGAVLVVAALVAACGGDDDDSDADEPAETEASADEPSATEAPADEPATTEAPATEAPAEEPAATDPPTTEAPAPADGEPIQLGAVVSLTGPAVFPEASAAASAYFDFVNENGGVNGRPIEYTTLDDAGDPNQAASAARSLVEDTGVVALAGGASLLECAVNGQYYAEQVVFNVSGTGVDPGCFASPNISPVNTGPYLGTTVSLYYLSEDRGFESICYVQQSVPSFNDAFTAAADQWTALTGKELAMPIQFFNPTDDVTPLVVNLAGNCDAVFMSLTEAPLLAFMQAVQLQGGGGDMVLMSQTSGFTEQVAEALGDAGQGLLANSEFIPFNSDDPALDEWRSIMEANDVPLTSFAIGGYLAAKIIVDTMSGIDGEVTRESVNAALAALESYETPLLGNPYSFGVADAHNPNRSSMIVELVDGTWTTPTGEWISLPAA
jgi:branched-chain amino acid transport system substrate-binding protein